MKNRYLLLILLIVASIWVYGQGVPLESHLMGQNQAGSHNLKLISVGSASIGDATITNATVTDFHSVQGFPFKLVGGASSEVLAVQEDLTIRPTDPNLLVEWPEEAPAFAHIVADVTRISATNAVSQITILEGTNMAFTVDEINSRITLTSLANGSTNPAYSSIAVPDQGAANATGPASQFTLIPGSNIEMTLDAVNHNLEILAQARGSGNGVPTVIVAASDSLNKASADFICDGTDDQVEINAAIERIAPIGGVCYLMEGAFKITDSILVRAPGVELRGSGWHSVINAGTNCVANSGYILAGSDTVGVKGIRIADLTVCGNSGIYGSANNHGIWVDNPMQFRADHVRVMDCGGRGLHLDDGTEFSQSMITNSLFTTNALEGLYISQIGCLTVSSCVFSGNGGDGIELAANGKPAVAIAGCASYNNGGAGFYNINGYATITGCVARSNYGDFVLGANCVANGCSSYLSDAGGFIILGSNVTISGGYVNGPNGKGIEINDNVDQVNINGTYIYSAAEDGIVVNAGCDNILISGNWINASLHGVYLGGSFTGLHSNYIYNCGHSGVYACGDSDIIQNNFLYNNGGGGSYPAVHVVNDDYVVIQKNRFHDTAGSSPAIKIDPDGGDDTQYPYITLNRMTGVWAAETVDSSANGPGHEDFLEQWNGAADVYILAGSSGARIGIATRENINNVLTISPSAPTNPIANGWDTWSKPDLKEDIKPLVEDERKQLLSEFDALRDAAIQFDWKYPQPEPQPTDFEDIKDETGEIVATALEQYEYAYDSWARGKAEWEALPHKKNQRGWLITDPNFPERLKGRDIKGEVVGVNMSQMVFEIYNAVQQGLEDLEALKKELKALRR